MQNEILEFTRLSRRAGERYDLIQAGGGNSSLKTASGRMLIKPSGISLADVTAADAQCEVDYRALADALRGLSNSPARADKDSLNKLAGDALAGASTGAGTPSIETFMHALMGRAVLHTHPLSVSAVVCSGNWREVLTAAFPDALLAPYATAGATLALELLEMFAEAKPDFSNDTVAVFLQSHGMVVSSPTADGALEATERIALELERAAKSDYSHYRNVSAISALVNGFCGTDMICHACADKDVLEISGASPELLNGEPFSPDIVVYTGLAPLVIDSPDAAISLSDYIEKYNAAPRVVVFDGRPYVMADSIRKARDVESVIKYELLVRSSASGGIIPLPGGEAEFISRWEAERRREKL